MSVSPGSLGQSAHLREPPGLCSGMLGKLLLQREGEKGREMLSGDRRSGVLSLCARSTAVYKGDMHFDKDTHQES